LIDKNKEIEKRRGIIKTVDLTEDDFRRLFCEGEVVVGDIRIRCMEQVKPDEIVKRLEYVQKLNVVFGGWNMYHSHGKK